MRININKTDRSSIIKPPKIYQYFHPQISHGNPTSCIERSDLSSHVRCKNPAVGDDNPTDIRCPRANFAGLSTVGKIPVSLVPGPLVLETTTSLIHIINPRQPPYYFNGAQFTPMRMSRLR